MFPDLAFSAAAYLPSSSRASQTSTCTFRGQPARGSQPRRAAAARRQRACACASSSAADDQQLPEAAFAPDTEYDDMASDDEYVVIDGKDVGLLIEEMRAQGLDDIGSAQDSVAEVMLGAAERASGRSKGKEEVEKVELEEGDDEWPEFIPKESYETSDSAAKAPAPMKDVEVEGAETAMEYFTEENVSLMPSWARDAFLSGNHHEIEDGAKKLGQDRSTRRLEVILNASKSKISDDETGGEVESPLGEDGVESEFVARDDGKVPVGDLVDDEWSGAGISDCSVADVAVDYNIPVELVIDIMSVYGVELPITPSDSVRERLATDEIERMLELITSFDCMDLSDRYSDQTIAELADEYDTDVNAIVTACVTENIHLTLGLATRLQLTREDRVLAIARGRALPGGFEYPPLLHGLVVGDDPIPTPSFIEN